MQDSDIKSFLTRLEKLEQKVFGTSNPSKPHVTSKKTDEFVGITGGVRFLNAHGFLDKKRSLSDIREELQKHGYHSSIQAVQTSLNRLSKTGGPLIAFKENGKKVYAKRK